MPITILQLQKRYVAPDGTAVPVIDIGELKLGDGEQVALIGTSGSGKTTLLHMLAGIVRPDAGHIVLTPSSPPYLHRSTVRTIAVLQWALNFCVLAFVALALYANRSESTSLVVPFAGLAISIAADMLVFMLAGALYGLRKGIVIGIAWMALPFLRLAYYIWVSPHVQKLHPALDDAFPYVMLLLLFALIVLLNVNANSALRRDNLPVYVLGALPQDVFERAAMGPVDLMALDEADRDVFRGQHIGYVFQTHHLLGGFTALENVLLGMSFTGRSPDHVWAMKLLTDVGLADRMHYRPEKLSVGQQQRVAVARALANRPRLVLADEPTGALDSRNAQQVLELIRRLCREVNATLLLVTHDLNIARQLPRVLTLAEINRAAIAAPPLEAPALG